MKYKTNSENDKCGEIAHNSINMGEANGMWKGDKVGYGCLHRWVERQLGKPKKCEHCGITTAKKNEKVDNNCFCDKSEPDKTITLGKHEGRYARCKNCKGRIWH